MSVVPLGQFHLNGKWEFRYFVNMSSVRDHFLWAELCHEQKITGILHWQQNKAPFELCIEGFILFILYSSCSKDFFQQKASKHNMGSFVSTSVFHVSWFSPCPAIVTFSQTQNCSFLILIRGRTSALLTSPSTQQGEKTEPSNQIRQDPHLGRIGKQRKFQISFPTIPVPCPHAHTHIWKETEGKHLKNIHITPKETFWCCHQSPNPTGASGHRRARPAAGEEDVPEGDSGLRRTWQRGTVTSETMEAELVSSCSLYTSTVGSQAFSKRCLFQKASSPQFLVPFAASWLLWHFWLPSTGQAWQGCSFLNKPLVQAEQLQQTHRLWYPNQTQTSWDSSFPNSKHIGYA